MSLEVARAVCRSCPVRSECLDAALVEEAELGPLEAHGVRGGLTAPQRAGLVVARRSGPAVSRPEADSAIGEPAPARAAL
jgi:hypothetical protein